MPLIHTPHSREDTQDFESERRDNIVVAVAGSYIGIEHCRTIADRARIITLLAGTGSVAIETTALWIHTGVTTFTLADHLKMLKTTDRRWEFHRYEPADVTTIGSLSVTTMERTIIDLILNDFEIGLGQTLPLVRAGADLDYVARRASRLSRLRGAPRLIKVARQLPASIGSLRSSSGLEPTTR